MTCLLFRKGNKAKQFTLYFYLLQTGSRSKHLRQFVLSPSLSYNGRKESSKIACQCQEPWAFFFFLNKNHTATAPSEGMAPVLARSLLHLYSRDCVFSGLASSAEGRAVNCVSVPVLPAQVKVGCRLSSMLIISR